MIITLNEVCKRVQDALSDPSGSQFTTASLITPVNQCFDDLSNEISQLELSYERVVAVINPFPAGTTDTSAYEADGGSLQAINEPELVEYKLVGEDDTQYKKVDRVDKVDDVAAGTPGITSYEWRGGVVYVSKSSVDVILRIRFQAMSTNLVDATDKVTRGVTNVLAYKVAEYVAGKRGGDNGTKLAQRYGAKAQAALDNFLVMAVKNDQMQNRRLGTVRGRRRAFNYVAR